MSQQKDTIEESEHTHNIILWFYQVPSFNKYYLEPMELTAVFLPENPTDKRSLWWIAHRLQRVRAEDRATNTFTFMYKALIWAMEIWLSKETNLFNLVWTTDTKLINYIMEYFIILLICWAKVQRRSIE